MFRPWVCGNNHYLEIEEVDDDGKCMRCNANVYIDATPKRVQEALARDRLRPVKHVLIAGRYHKLLTHECGHCGALYETPYANSRYCDPECKKQQARRRDRERRTGNLHCSFCGGIIPSPDKRRKFCGARCREDMKRGSHGR